MNIYVIKKIRVKPGMTVDEYNNEYENAPFTFVKGIKGITEFCGGMLKKVGYGYCGTNGNIEYIAIKWERKEI